MLKQNQGIIGSGETAIEQQEVDTMAMSTSMMFGVGRGFYDEENQNENYSYLNDATCPDCSGGMVRLGNCHSCPSCGFESCSI